MGIVKELREEFKTASLVTATVTLTCETLGYLEQIDAAQRKGRSLTSKTRSGDLDAQVNALIQNAVKQNLRMREIGKKRNERVRKEVKK